MGVLASRIVLEIYYRLSFKYLIVEDIVRDSKAGLEAKPRIESFFGKKILSILLSLKKEAQNVRATKGATKARFLYKRPLSWTEVILIILKSRIIFSNRLINLLGLKLLEFYKRVVCNGAKL